MTKAIEQLTKEIEAAEKLAEVSDRYPKLLFTLNLYLTLYLFRHVVGTNAIVVVDAHYTGNQCGQFVSHPCHVVNPSSHPIFQTLTSFSNNLNVYLKADGTAGTAPFSSGTFTAPVNGWYHICSFSRFKNSGNSNDVTILTVSTLLSLTLTFYDFNPRVDQQ